MRLLSLLAAVALVPALAQTRTVDDLRTVRVTGSGQASAPSDEAVVQVSFTTEGESAEQALAQHQVEVDRVQALLDARGIDPDQVSVDRASVSPTGGRGMGMGGDDEGAYAVSRSLTVRTRDLDAIPELVAALSTDAADDALAVQMRNVTTTYTLADDAALREQALREAVADARRRATLLAEMAGVELGAVLDVAEAGVGVAGGGFEAMMAAVMQAERMGGGGESGHTVSAAVVVTFLIAP